MTLQKMEKVSVEVVSRRHRIPYREYSLSRDSSMFFSTIPCVYPLDSDQFGICLARPLGHLLISTALRAPGGDMINSHLLPRLHVQPWSWFRRQYLPQYIDRGHPRVLNQDCLSLPFSAKQEPRSFLMVLKATSRNTL